MWYRAKLIGVTTHPENRLGEDCMSNLLLSEHTRARCRITPTAQLVHKANKPKSTHGTVSHSPCPCFHSADTASFTFSQVLGCLFPTKTAYERKSIKCCLYPLGVSRRKCTANICAATDASPVSPSYQHTTINSCTTPLHTQGN